MKTPIAPDTPEKPSWHVLGAGAIGGLWALRMARLAMPVTLLAHGSSTGTRTLSIEEKNGIFSHRFPEVSAADSAVITHLLVCTKAQLTVSAMTPLLAQLQKGATVLLLQNGMGQEDWLQQERPDICLLTGSSTDGVWRRDRDHLVQAGLGETFIGAARSGDEAAARALAASLQDKHWPVHFDADIRQRRWLKLAMNCAINPLTAIYRCKNGELLEKPEALATMLTVCAEVAEVMNAEGMATDTETLFKAVCAAAEKTAANISSMHADVAAGRETEITFINGYVLARAAAHGIAVPTNQSLLNSISSLPRH
ncbi:MAG: 2-dehydropantoate 2-reductase [Pedobacter sp.]|nr:2-dehydropantoate 2-reductase [Pedobacter sp.]